MSSFSWMASPGSHALITLSVPRLERLCRVETTRQSLSRRGTDKVISACEPGDAIQENDDILLDLDQTLCTLQGQLDDSNMVLGGLVERRTDHLAPNRLLHVRDFLGSLID